MRPIACPPFKIARNNLVAAGVVFTALLIPAWPIEAADFSVVEASIPDMQAAMHEGEVTSRELVTQYLVRIATYENKLKLIVKKCLLKMDVMILMDLLVK